MTQLVQMTTEFHDTRQPICPLAIDSGAPGSRTLPDVSFYVPIKLVGGSAYFTDSCPVIGPMIPQTTPTWITL